MALGSLTSPCGPRRSTLFYSPVWTADVRETELVLGRRWSLVLEPGEEVIAALDEWCARTGVRAGTVDLFFGAFRSVTLIAGRDDTVDPELPLPTSVEVAYLEGIGSGSIAQKDGSARVHLHVAAGVKSAGGAAYAGHLLSAEVHYTVEVVVQEVLSPELTLRVDPRAHGIGCLFFE